MSDFNPDWISPPGDTMLDIMKEANIMPDQFADLMGLNDDETNNLLRGVTPITREVARKLTEVLGAPASFWMNREQQYRNELHRLATSKPELVIRQAEVNKVELKPGQVLVVKISGDQGLISQEDMASLKKGFQSIFPNNKVVLLALPEGSSIDLTVGDASLYPETSQPKESCSVVNYCNDCSCGKKEFAEELSKKKG